MSNSQPVQAYNETDKRFAYLAYVLFFLGVISLGVFSTFGLILAYVRRKDNQGTIFYSHFSYLIKTYWIFLGVEILGFILLFLPVLLKIIGGLILIGIYIWYLYRLISGFSKLSENKMV